VCYTELKNPFADIVQIVLFHSHVGIYTWIRYCMAMEVNE